MTEEENDEQILHDIKGAMLEAATFVLQGRGRADRFDLMIEACLQNASKAVVVAEFINTTEDAMAALQNSLYGELVTTTNKWLKSGWHGGTIDGK